MKNKLKILSALMIALCGFMFTGCDDLAKEVDCWDQWYKYQITYSKGNATAVLDCYLIYIDDEYNGNDEINTSVSGEFKKGLNIIIEPDADPGNDILNTIAEGFTEGKFIIKSLPEGDSLAKATDTDEGKAKKLSSLSMSPTLWTAIYLKLRTTGNLKNKGDDAPSVICKPTSKPLTIKADFDFKDLLVLLLDSYL